MLCYQFVISSSIILHIIQSCCKTTLETNSNSIAVCRLVFIYVMYIIVSTDGCKDSGAILLKGGSSPKEGRVEICMDSEWGTICDNDWDTPDAQVVCRQLGFSDKGRHVHMPLAFILSQGIDW